MTLTDSEAISEITRRIVERFHPQRVVLFGSRARGDARPDSDFDILIVAPSHRERWERSVPVYCEIAQIDAPNDVDIVWWTPDEIARWRDARTHFITTVLREGKELYACAA